MTKIVNTVRGPVAADDLGVTLIHEHIQFGYPGFEGDRTCAPYDREKAIKNVVEQLEQVKAYGVKTIVDATPNECGRDPEFMKEVSEITGVNIICSSGYYYEGLSAAAYWNFRTSMVDITEEIYEMMKKEATVGIGNTGIKAGVFKLASSKNKITDYEKAFFKAAARVCREDGTQIITHTQEATMGPEQAELLLSEGADPKRVMIGHMCGSSDLAYYKNVLEQGVYIGFDRLGVEGLVGCPTDKMRMTCLTALINAGYVDRIMLSHDYSMEWLGRPMVLPDELVARWNCCHVFKHIIPDLKEAGMTDEQINMMLVENPKRFLGV